MSESRVPGALLLAAALAAAGCTASAPQPAPDGTTAAAEEAAPEPPPARASAASLSLIEYRNGWSDEERRRFYHLSEGGEVIPLSLLQALERAPLAEDGPGPGLRPFMQNLERYGFIPDETSRENPFGLPVGMTVARDRATGSLRVGFNCSACHVGEVWHNGRRARLDGAPNMVRLNDLFADLNTEVQATIRDTSRRRRLEGELLARLRANSAIVPLDKTLVQRGVQLVENLGMVQRFIAYLEGMPTLRYAATGIQNGYGRVDAFGVARNLLFGSDPRNVRLQNAPASMPHMWGIERTAWLQWGSNMNSVIERNLGQALGVGALYDPKTLATTAQIGNLNTLEHLMYTLTPPTWPTEVFGPVDEARAAAGRAVYDRACAACHDRPFEVSPTGLVTYQLFSPEVVGTSPYVAKNFDEAVIVDGKEMRFAAAAFAQLERIKQEYYRANNISAETQRQWEMRSLRPPPRIRSTYAEAASFPDSKAGRGGGVYAARPLAGIWATAPYLNNGSVANMWDLLTAARDRPLKFTLGSREYDPRTLGYRTTPDPTSPAPPWEFFTTIPWNTNAGHNYGTTLSDDEKWALIEFLKVLRPGEITRAPVQGGSGTAAGRP